MQYAIYMCIKTHISTYLYTAYSSKVIIIDIGSYIYLLFFKVNTIVNHKVAFKFPIKILYCLFPFSFF